MKTMTQTNIRKRNSYVKEFTIYFQYSLHKENINFTALNKMDNNE